MTEIAVDGIGADLGPWPWRDKAAYPPCDVLAWPDHSGATSEGHPSDKGDVARGDSISLLVLPSQLSPAARQENTIPRSGLLIGVDEAVQMADRIIMLTPNAGQPHDPIIIDLPRLGFAEVDDADIKLTPVGQQWAQASPSDDKKIFAAQARDRAPLVRTIVRALSEAPDGKLSKQFFLDLLEHDFAPEQARAQLDTAIHWGRYGELYTYLAHDGQFALWTAVPA